MRNEDVDFQASRALNLIDGGKLYRQLLSEYMQLHHTYTRHDRSADTCRVFDVIVTVASEVFDLTLDEARERVSEDCQEFYANLG